MSDEWKKGATRAAKLAAWTNLSAVEFSNSYRFAFDREKARPWSVLAADVFAINPAADDKILIEAASREAEQKSFIERLVENVVELESGDHGRSDTDIAELLREIGVAGIMQAITAPERSLMDAAIFGPLKNAADACACVYQGNTLLGTAFLVRPDMVLTAAHVVLEYEPNGEGQEDWVGRLRPNLSFSFIAPPQSTNSSRMLVPAAGTKPIRWALPHGTPPNTLDPSLNGSRSPSRLDFALVQLTKQVHHISWLDIRKPLHPQADRRCFTIGFAGGTELKFDDDVVTNIHKESGRFLHGVNTIPGMSGGCCVGPEGTVIALHEGATPRLGVDGRPVKNLKGKTIYDNRAVCLTNVRAAQCIQKPDPLENIGQSPGVSFNDPELVDGLYRAGVRLAGVTLEDRWRRTFQAMYGLADLPGPGRPMPEFHAWFQRKTFEDWVDNASGDAKDRICYVNGKRGSGKSFCSQIVNAKLSDPISNLVLITSTQTSAWSWEDAITPALRGAEAAIQGTEAATRLKAGAIKYDDMPVVIESLSTIQGRKRDAQTPLFIVIDFEEGESLRSGQSHWYSFIETLAKEEWTRLVLIGLSEDEQLDIDLSLKDNPLTREIEPTKLVLDYITEGELVTYLIELAASRNVAIVPKTAREEVSKLWTSDLMLRAQQPVMQTVEAALCAALLEKEVRNG